MAQHIKILGILHIIYAGFVLLAGVIVLMVMGGIAGFLTANPGRYSDAQAAPSLLVVVGLGVFLFLLLLSLPGIIAGFGLLAFKEWSRIMTIVLSAFELLSVPFGTAIGIYGLWVLLKPESESLFRRPQPMRRVS